MNFFTHHFLHVLPKGIPGAVIIALLGISGCAMHGIKANSDRNAKIAHQDSFGDRAHKVIYPQQNWSPADSLWFYSATQGSNLIPYEIFLHLEMPDSEQLFRSDENMNRLRYLPQKTSRTNPDALPIGWVKDEYKGKAYIGLNCAACHTTQINYEGTAIRIDGGATLADMDLMLRDLALALDTSLNHPMKFERLARKVLKARYAGQRESFRAELASTTQKIQAYNRVNEPVHKDELHGDQLITYGYGRLDAFGRIYNRILEHLTPNDPTNHNPPNAPVSYSYLWDTPHHDFVEWNGVGDNEAKGPLLRNAGEAMGVFATFDLHQGNNDGSYPSSIIVPNLIKMERSLESLWSPRWQDLAEQGALPPINAVLAEQGRKVYQDYQCHTCHEVIERTDPNRRIIARFASLPIIGTDALMASNTLEYKGKSGVFEGRQMNPKAPEPIRFEEVTRVLPALSLAAELMTPESGADKAPISDAIRDNPIKNTQRHLDFEIVDKNNWTALAAYKARPLNGVWTSAPYLHNGSVPSLYELFMPSCGDDEIARGKTCRPNKFTVGTRELDPVKVGFVQRDPAEFPGLFVFDTRLPGNSNKGHEYTAGITPVFVLNEDGRPRRDAQGKPLMRKLPPISSEQRRALVEYLKTL